MLTCVTISPKEQQIAIGPIQTALKNTDYDDRRAKATGWGPKKLIAKDEAPQWGPTKVIAKGVKRIPSSFVVHSQKRMNKKSMPRWRITREQPPKFAHVSRWANFWRLQVDTNELQPTCRAWSWLTCTAVLYRVFLSYSKPMSDLTSHEYDKH